MWTMLDAMNTAIADRMIGSQSCRTDDSMESSLLLWWAAAVRYWYRRPHAIAGAAGAGRGLARRGHRRRRFFRAPRVVLALQPAHRFPGRQRAAEGARAARAALHRARGLSPVPPGHAEPPRHQSRRGPQAAAPHAPLGPRGPRQGAPDGRA